MPIKVTDKNHFVINILDVNKYWPISSTVSYLKVDSS